MYDVSVEVIYSKNEVNEKEYAKLKQIAELTEDEKKFALYYNLIGKKKVE